MIPEDISCVCETTKRPIDVQRLTVMERDIVSGHKRTCPMILSLELCSDSIRIYDGISKVLIKTVTFDTIFILYI